MAQDRSVRDFDWWLLAISLVLCAVGVLQIYSATLDSKLSGAWWKQIIWIVLSLIAMWLLTQIDYHTLLGQVPILYSVSIGLLVLTIFTTRVLGASRWIGYGMFKFQVSEFFKIVVVLLVAKYLAELKSEGLDGRDLLRLTGFVGVPTLLVMFQPDLGTSLTYLPILAIGILIAGLRWQHVVTIAVFAGLFAWPAWMLMKDYQKDRVLTFVDPGRDPKGAGYQVIQSRIAIGSGEIWGKGATKGYQTQLRFLPMPQTDFIFATFAEEHGFVGVSVVLGLYFLLLLQIVQNAQTAPDRAGMYICMGVAALLLFHVIENVGMVVGRMPVAGIPLPLMSSGGSNLLSVFMMLGLVNNVRLRRFVN
ncbi:MAG TPA: rod shape-determining protein RodA [Bryobacteraceae bacterium]